MLIISAQMHACMHYFLIRYCLSSLCPQRLSRHIKKRPPPTSNNSSSLAIFTVLLLFTFVLFVVHPFFLQIYFHPKCLKGAVLLFVLYYFINTIIILLLLLHFIQKLITFFLTNNYPFSWEQVAGSTFAVVLRLPSHKGKKKTIWFSTCACVFVFCRCCTIKTLAI